MYPILAHQCSKVSESSFSIDFCCFSCFFSASAHVLSKGHLRHVSRGCFGSIVSPIPSGTPHCRAGPAAGHLLPATTRRTAERETCSHITKKENLNISQTKKHWKPMVFYGLSMKKHISTSEEVGVLTVFWRFFLLLFLFPRASERRVLLIVGGLSNIFTSSHLHTTSSNLHIFSSTHPHIFTSAHLHILSSSHLHNIST
jgi:hypothetical protein